MAWTDIKNLSYPVLDAEGALVAIFSVEKLRDQFVDANNKALTGDELVDLKLTKGEYVDYDTVIHVRGS